MPWIQITESSNREIWLRTEGIIGLAQAKQHGSGTMLLLLSGTNLEVAEHRDGAAAEDQGSGRHRGEGAAGGISRGVRERLPRDFPPYIRRHRGCSTS